MKMNIKKGDTVVVISGDDKHAKGKVIQVAPKENKVLVEGVNMVHKHVKPRKEGDQGGILEVEGAIYASKVMVYCSKCDKGVRVKHSEKNGKKIRVCAKCGAEL